MAERAKCMTMVILHLLCVIGMAFFMSSHASAAIRVTITCEGERVVGAWSEAHSGYACFANPVMTGHIGEQEVARLEELVSEGFLSTQAGKIPFAKVLLLDSVGGSVAGAMELGRWLREGNWWTNVTKDSQCLSACSLVLVGGVGRIIEGEVGIHRIRLDQAHMEKLSLGEFMDVFSYTEREIAKFLQAMNVDPHLAFEMMGYQSGIIHRLSGEEMDRFRLRGTDPAWEEFRRHRAKAQGAGRLARHPLRGMTLFYSAARGAWTELDMGE